QFVARLTRDEVEREGNRAFAAEPLCGFDPAWMRRAVIIAKPGDLVGIELDPPGRCAQLVLLGVGAELAKQHVFVHARWYFDPTLLPERIEIRNKVALCALTERAIDMPQPGCLVPAFGKALLAAEAPGEIMENVEVVVRLADRLDRLVHRN